MIVLRSKYFSDKKSDATKEAGSIAALAGGSAILANTKPGRLTGRVVRYHNTAEENVDNILKEGIKGEYAANPKNLTNTVIPDIPIEKKKNLIYTSKTKKGAEAVGQRREELLNKKGRTLKLEFDYDDIKEKKKIANPELRGARNPRELADLRAAAYDNAVDAAREEARRNRQIFWAPLDFNRPRPWKDSTTQQQLETKFMFEDLGERGTHIFEGNVPSRNIVGGAGYKKRTLKDIGRYIKNNPARFGKEAAKVATGAALATGGAYGLYKINKNKRKKKNAD